MGAGGLAGWSAGGGCLSGRWRRGLRYWALAMAAILGTRCVANTEVPQPRAIEYRLPTPTPEPVNGTLVLAPISWGRLPLPTPVQVREALAEEATVSGPAALPEVRPPARGALFDGELREVLRLAGWAPEELLGEAVRVVRGGSNCPNGESGANPGATNGRYRGLFQLDTPFWFDWAGIDSALWSDPVANARVAWLLYQRSGWGPWECQP